MFVLSDFVRVGVCVCVCVYVRVFYLHILHYLEWEVLTCCQSGCLSLC